MKTALLAWLSVVAAVGLAAAGLHQMATRPSDGGPAGPEPLFPVPAERDVGTVPLGVCPVAFDLTNTAARPRRVLGAEASCKKNCIRAGADELMTIGPGETVAYGCELVLKVEGPFELEMPILIEDNGIREIVLKVRGVAVRAEKSHAQATP